MTEATNRPLSRRATIAGIAAGVSLPLVVEAVDETAEAKKVHGIIATKKVPVGGGVVIPARQVIVTQPTKGKFHVFSAICTHLGCTVGGVVNGLIECPCHGSEYSPATGHVVRGPAQRALAKRRFTIKSGQIVLT